MHVSVHDFDVPPVYPWLLGSTAWAAQDGAPASRQQVRPVLESSAGVLGLSPAMETVLCWHEANSPDGGAHVECVMKTTLGGEGVWGHSHPAEGGHPTVVSPQRYFAVAVEGR